LTIVKTSGHPLITVATSSSMIAIIDDDSATVNIAGTTDGDETAPTNGLFTVTQTLPSSTNTVLTYVATGTASPGTDYTTLSGTLTIPAGATSATVPITVTDDAIVENTETVTLTISKSSGDADVTVGTSNATINILDITYLIAYLYKGGPAPVPYECVGDVNGNSAVNILDITYLIAYLYKGGPAPVTDCCNPVWK